MIQLYAVSVSQMDNYGKYMLEALKEARSAGAVGDVPIGAVIVKDGVVVSRASNRTERDGDPTMHAEIAAIRAASEVLGTPRLVGCTLFVTVEPCAMCAGACVLARLDAVVAGTDSPKSGAAGSVRDILTSGDLNHSPAYETGVMREECASLMSDFFAGLRKERKDRREEIITDI
jgi:tRNA(adenine34) deaminase